MGAKIPVKVSKPREGYILTSGDIRSVSRALITQLGEEDAKKLAQTLCYDLKIESFEKKAEVL